MTRFLLFSASCLVTLAIFFLVAKSVAPTLMSSLSRGDQSVDVEFTPASLSPAMAVESSNSYEPPARRQVPANAPTRPIEVSERQFDRLSRQGVVLVKFGADWCGPCRRVDAELKKLAQHNAGDLTVLTVNVDDEERLSRRFSVGSIPHMILLQDGQQVQQWVGYQSADRLQRAIRKANQPSGQVHANPFTT